MKRYGVHPSVCPSHLLQSIAADLLLWARRPGDTDRLLQQRRTVSLFMLWPHGTNSVGKPTAASGVNSRHIGFLATGAQCDILLNCAL